MILPLALSLAVALQAAPAPAPGGVAVLLTRRVDFPRLTAGEIVDAVGAAVEAEKLDLVPAAAVARRLKAARLPETDACAGKKECVLNLGRVLGVAVVVEVQAGSLASSEAPVAVHLEALRVADGASLADLDAEVQRDQLKAIAGLADFTRQVRESLAGAPAVATPQPAPGATPAPVPTGKPAQTDPHVVVAVPPPPPLPEGVPPEALGTAKAAEDSHTAGKALIGVAGAAAAGAVACLVAGLVLKGSLDGEVRTDGLRYVDLTRDGAESRVSQVNALMTTSLVAGIAAVGLGTAGVIAW